MPNIRLITARPGPSGPTLTAEGFGAPAARGLQTLGQGLGEAGAQLNQIAQAEIRIKEAKDEQLLRERIAQAGVALDDARFRAEETVPSDADAPEQVFTQILAGKKKKTLQQEFEETADANITNLEAGLRGERLDRFRAVVGIDRDQALLKIRAVKRARDIDAGRASFVRMEDILRSQAADPNADIGVIQARYADAADTALVDGLFKQEAMAVVKATFKKETTKIHKEAQFLAQVEASVNELMTVPLSKGDRIKVARAQHDGRFEEEVVKAIKLQSDEETASLVAAEKEATNASWTDLRNGSGKEAIRPAVSGKSKVAMDKFITKRAAVAAKGGQLVFTTRPDVYEDVLSLAADQTPEGVEKFNALNLLDSDIRMNLADKDWNLFDKLQQRSRNGLDAGPEGRALFGDSVAAEDLMTRSGISNADDRKAAKREMQLQAEFEAEEKGSKLTPSEKDAAMIRGAGRIELIDRHFFVLNETKRYRDLTAEDREFILDDPEDAVPDLVKRFKNDFARRGVPEPTPLQLENAIDDWFTSLGVPGGSE